MFEPDPNTPISKTSSHALRRAAVLVVASLATPLLAGCGGGDEGGPTDPAADAMLSFEPIQGAWEGSGTFGDDVPFTITTFELGEQAAVGDSIGRAAWESAGASCTATLLARDSDPEQNSYTIQISIDECTSAAAAIDEGKDIILNHLPGSELIDFESTGSSSGTLRRK